MTFCYQDMRYYNTYNNLKEYTKSIIDQSFEDKDYRNSLIQFFHDKKSIIKILSYVTNTIWKNQIV
jgi:hypothetical protein